MSKIGNRKSVRSADARSNSSFSGCGGDGGDSMSGCRPSTGMGGSGSKVRHASPKSKANIKPPNAHAHASFSGVGGKGRE